MLKQHEPQLTRTQIMTTTKKNLISAFLPDTNLSKPSTVQGDATGNSHRPHLLSPFLQSLKFGLVDPFSVTTVYKAQNKHLNVPHVEVE